MTIILYFLLTQIIFLISNLGNYQNPELSVRNRITEKKEEEKIKKEKRKNKREKEKLKKKTIRIKEERKKRRKGNKEKK